MSASPQLRLICNNNKRHDITRHYDVKFIHDELDELEDVVWTTDGFSQMQHLSRHIDTLSEHFGPFAEVQFNRHTPTKVRYRAIVDEDNKPLKGTFGKHPEFYQGWNRAMAKSDLFPPHLNYQRFGHRKEMRYWVRGYIHSCQHLLELTNGIASKVYRSHPYQVGVLEAFKHVKERSQEDIEKRKLRYQDNEISSIHDSQLRQGYLDMLEVVSLVWKNDSLDV